MPLFLLFLIVPLIEIALFIQVGGVIGLWPTLGIVILTAIAGAYLVRSQGLAVVQQLEGRLREFSDPREPLAHGAMILFSGALLLTPGFFTDVVGFALLVPGVRRWLMTQLSSRIKVQTTGFDHPPKDDGVIEGEYEDLDQPSKQDGPSGWTRH